MHLWQTIAMSTAMYPHLLSPLKVGALQLKNRVIMGSMHLGVEEQADGLQRMAAFYAERAAGGAALIITGGIAPNSAGRLTADGTVLDTEAAAHQHRTITTAVHNAGGLIAAQLLHAGRYGAHTELVAPSAIQAPISPLTPRQLSANEVADTIADFARAAKLAQLAGYDGVEIMGSEGYLINQFLAPRTNQRTDEWGGSAAKRHRFAVEIVRRVREEVGDNFAIIFRLSMLDLVADGSELAEVLELARKIEAAGADMLGTGIGWHESRVPTIATTVPRGAFTWITDRVARAVTIPVSATNRINTPDLAEKILADTAASAVTLARPFLADPQFVQKASAGRAQHINTCIACNQACLDHVFSGKPASCLVNPRAGRETELVIAPAVKTKQIAVVGAGPAGLSCAVTLAQRGHSVTLFDSDTKIGGQLNIAMQIPGKTEFAETLRYFKTQLAAHGVTVKLGREVSAASLTQGGFDEVVLATGVTPRRPELPGVDLPHVKSYLSVLRDGAPVGRRALILGAGGIGFDTALFLTASDGDSDHDSSSESPEATATFLRDWGVDPEYRAQGALTRPASRSAVPRQVTMLQRSSGKPGARLGKTTGWIHRAELQQRGVQLFGGVEYLAIEEAGLRARIDGKERLLEADTIVLCTGQETNRLLADSLDAAGVKYHLIGGAHTASELDAKRAIRQGTELGAAL